MKLVETEQLTHQEREAEFDVSSDAVTDADELHETLAEMADSFDVGGFKCVHEQCGMAHMHDTTKHQLSKSFDISDEDAVDIEFNSVCHCGLNEAARHGDDFGVDEMKAASRAGSAPIPPETSRVMDEKFGRP